MRRRRVECYYSAYQGPPKEVLTLAAATSQIFAENSTRGPEGIEVIAGGFAGHQIHLSRFRIALCSFENPTKGSKRVEITAVQLNSPPQGLFFRQRRREKSLGTRTSWDWESSIRTATMLSAAMMLEYLGLSAAAKRFEDAIRKVYAGGKLLTPDQGGTAKTKEF